MSVLRYFVLCALLLLCFAVGDYYNASFGVLLAYILGIFATPSSDAKQ